MGDTEKMRGSCGSSSWAGLGLHLLLPHGRTETCGEINDRAEVTALLQRLLLQQLLEATLAPAQHRTGLPSDLPSSRLAEEHGGGGGLAG